MTKPFEGVGRPFRSATACEVGRVARVANDVVGTVLLALPQVGGRDVEWFSGQVVTRDGQLQLVGVVEECASDCVCAGGYGHVKLTLTDGARQLRAVARCARTGGNCVCLEPVDAASVSFEAATVYSGRRAADLVAKFFPALERRLAAVDDAEAVVTAGTLWAKQLVFTDHRRNVDTRTTSAR